MRERHMQYAITVCCWNTISAKAKIANTCQPEKTLHSLLSIDEPGGVSGTPFVGRRPGSGFFCSGSASLKTIRIIPKCLEHLFPIQLCGQRPQNVRGEGRRRASPSLHFLCVEDASFRSESVFSLFFRFVLSAGNSLHCGA